MLIVVGVLLRLKARRHYAKRYLLLHVVADAVKRDLDAVLRVPPDLLRCPGSASTTPEALMRPDRSGHAGAGEHPIAAKTKGPIVV